MPNIQAFHQAAQKIGYNPHEIETFLSLAQGQNKPVSQVMAEHGQQSTLDALGKQGINPGDLDSLKGQNMDSLESSSPSSGLPTLSSPSSDFGTSMSPSSKNANPPPLTPPLGMNSSPTVSDLTNAPKQQSILPGQFQLGTAANQAQAADKFSGGINYGRDIETPKGTPIATPPTGKWKVVESFNGDPYEGATQSDATKGINRGYGNSALLENALTGERMRFSHLSENNLQPGQIVDGGTVFGKTGASGNVAGGTGQHLDLEYYDGTGKIRDVMDTPYGKMMFGGSGQSPVQSSGTPPAPAPVASVPTLQPTSVSSAAPSLPPEPVVSPNPPTPASMPQPSQTQENTNASEYSSVLQGVPANQQDSASKALPGVVNALKEQGILTPQVLAYTMATIGHESNFDPTRQEVMAHKGVDARNDNIANLQANYSGGSQYHGRGYVQLTHDYNYKKYGEKLGLDLVNNPELAADPANSARILAAYMKESGAADAAQAGDYVKARQLVQGAGATSPQWMPTTQAIANQANTYRHYLSK